MQLGFPGFPRSPHVDPVTGETARTSRTVGTRTKKGAEKARDALIFRLESDGGAVGSSMTVREFMEQFLCLSQQLFLGFHD